MKFSKILWILICKMRKYSKFTLNMFKLIMKLQKSSEFHLKNMQGLWIKPIYLLFELFWGKSENFMAWVESKIVNFILPLKWGWVKVAIVVGQLWSSQFYHMLTPEESGVNFDQRIHTFQIHLDERFSLTARLLIPHFHDSQVERPSFSAYLQNE